MRIQPVGIWLDSYRQDLKASLLRAAEQGFHAVHANHGAGPAALNPRELGPSARRHLLRYLDGLGLRLDSLGMVLPGAGLADPASADVRLAQLCETLELCADLGVRSSTVAIGGVANPDASPLAREVLAQTADYADRFGVRIAVLDGLAAPGELADAIRPYRAAPIGLALDSAALEGAIQTATNAPDLIAAVHLRDVRRAGAGLMEEAPFGTGEVDFLQLRAALAAAGYRGGEALRRDGPGPIDALRAGREYIDGLFPQFPQRGAG